MPTLGHPNRLERIPMESATNTNPSSGGVTNEGLVRVMGVRALSLGIVNMIVGPKASSM